MILDVIHSYCDFVNVMTYDLVLLIPIRPRAVLHSALNSQGILYLPFTVKHSIGFWLVLGLPRRMIFMGMTGESRTRLEILRRGD